jgi:hypothetical protein
MWTVYGAGFRGQALLDSGDIAGAGAVLEPLWHEGEDARSRLEGFFTAGPAIAEWALRAGRLEHGLRFCDWLVDSFNPQGAARLLGPVRFFRGCMLWHRSSARSRRRAGRGGRPGGRRA